MSSVIRLRVGNIFGLRRSVPGAPAYLPQLAARMTVGER